MKKPVKRVAVIHDICGVGKAALTNIIPVLSTMGAEVCPIPTMILSTHTGGFGIPQIVVNNDFVRKCEKHYMESGIEFEAIFVGYLGSLDNIKDSISFIKRNDKCKVILDPIFGDNGKYYCNFDDNYVNDMRELVKYSHIITPNYTEACLLVNEEYSNYFSKDKINTIIFKLKELGAENIVITSIPAINNDEIGIAIYENNNLSIIFEKRQSKSYPGTGDIFTSVLTGEILRGGNLFYSTKKSHYFVSKCIEESSKYDYPTKEGVLLERKLHLLSK